jgi:hypothetical protein
MIQHYYLVHVQQTAHANTSYYIHFPYRQYIHTYTPADQTQYYIQRPNKSNNYAPTLRSYIYPLLSIILFISLVPLLRSSPKAPVQSNIVT